MGRLQSVVTPCLLNLPLSLTNTFCSPEHLPDNLFFSICFYKVVFKILKVFLREFNCNFGTENTFNTIWRMILLMCISVRCFSKFCKSASSWNFGISVPARESNTFISEIENNSMKLYQAMRKILKETQGHK